MVPDQEVVLNTKTREIEIPTSNWLDNKWICTISDKEVGFFPPKAFRWKRSYGRGRNKGSTPYPVSERYPFLLRGPQVELCWSDTTSFLSRRARHGYSSGLPEAIIQTEAKIPVQIVEPTVKKDQNGELNWPATGILEMSKQRRQRPVPLKTRESHKLESNLPMSQKKGVYQDGPLNDSTVASPNTCISHPASSQTKLLSQDPRTRNNLSPGFIEVSDL